MSELGKEYRKQLEAKDKKIERLTAAYATSMEYQSELEDRIKVLESQLEGGMDGQSMLPTELLDGMHDRIKVLETEGKRLTMMLAEYVRLDNAGLIPMRPVAAADKEVSDGN